MLTSQIIRGRVKYITLLKNKQLPLKCYNVKRYGSSVPQNSTTEFTVFRSIWGKLFGKYLLFTNVLSSGVLMFVGDFLAQNIENCERKNCGDSYDTTRMWRMFIVGSLQGPLHHYGYKWLDNILPETTIKTTVQKILFDQIVFSPICILSFFYPACFFENKSLAAANQEILLKFPYIYITDWCIWPAAQFINFYYVKTKYRVIFVNVLTALYNVFISYIKHDDSEAFQKLSRMYVLRLKELLGC